MQTVDGAQIYTHYQGRLALPPEMAEMTPAGTAPHYETGSAKYTWVNKIQAIVVGRVAETGVAYKIYEVLERTISGGCRVSINP
jgi:uncharacterized protein DUF3237